MKSKTLIFSLLAMSLGGSYLYTPVVVAQSGPAAPAGEQPAGAAPFVTMGQMIDALEEKADEAQGNKKQKGAAKAAREAKISVSILFKYDSTEVMPASQAQVDEMGKALSDGKLKGFKYEIAGHTDTTGNDAYNKELSQKRADSVKAYLVQKYNIEADRLVAVGYGESKPIYNPDDNDAKRLANRRVEIVRKERYMPNAAK